MANENNGKAETDGDETDAALAERVVELARGHVADQLYQIAHVLVLSRSPAAYAAARIIAGRMRADALEMGEPGFLAELDRCIDQEIERHAEKERETRASAGKLARAFADLLKVSREAKRGSREADA